jgi:hypothetical protein
MLFDAGGEAGAGLARELLPLMLALLELFRLPRPRLNRALWKLMRLAAAGEYLPIQSPPGLACILDAKGLVVFSEAGLLESLYT